MENPGCEDVPGHQVVAACMIVANNSSIKKAINIKQTERTTMFPERYWFFYSDFRSIEAIFKTQITDRSKKVLDV
jgi:hypothetical protein